MNLTIIGYAMIFRPIKIFGIKRFIALTLKSTGRKTVALDKCIAMEVNQTINENNVEKYG